MVSANQPLQGRIRGRFIELDRDLGLPDGEEVILRIERGQAGSAPASSDGIRASFGGWSEDTEDLDRYLEWNRQQRKVDRSVHDDPENSGA